MEKHTTQTTPLLLSSPRERMRWPLPTDTPLKERMGDPDYLRNRRLFIAYFGAGGYVDRGLDPQKALVELEKIKEDISSQLGKTAVSHSDPTEYAEYGEIQDIIQQESYL